MQTAAPGDLVWTRKAVKSVTEGADPVVTLRGVSGCDSARRMLPDHPALPAVAAWLRETPDAVAAVRRLLAAATFGQPVLAETAGTANAEAAIAAGRALLAALQPGGGS